MLPTTRSAPSPAQLLSHWLTAGGEPGAARLLRLGDGRVVPLPVSRWTGPVDAADETMLARVEGPVLDVGCGPGRLTAALHARGCDVLGLELLPEVPVLVRQAGAPLLVGDVFGAVPGGWRTVLLADGNVGIGGDATRLLRRVRSLLADGGRVVCELLPYGDAPGPVRLEDTRTASAWFGWAMPSRRSLPAVARAAGFVVADEWDCERRDFALLAAA